MSKLYKEHVDRMETTNTCSLSALVSQR